MLGKLFKHEMKATARLLLPLFLVLAVLTILDRIVIYLDIFKGVLTVIPGLITFVYVISIIAVVIVTTVLIIYRFYKNLITDEGYLMFTLPVKSHELITSKLIVATIWTVASFVGVVASIFFVVSGGFNLTEIRDGFQQFLNDVQRDLGSDAALFFIDLILMVILGVLNNILTVYVSIAIGQLFNGHKILGSIGAYIGISIVLQIVTSVGTALLAFIFRLQVNEISTLTQSVFPIILVFLAVLNVVYYLVTNFLFKRRLNLE